jgi:hypoxanthine phosphoribosyltransferase
MEQCFNSILITQEAIQARIASLASQINNDYQNKNRLLVCLLKGAVMFFADLVRYLDFYLELDFLSVSSYGSTS